MTYNPEKHHRRSIRLKGYDYSQAGAYYVTICTQNRACLFGDIVGGEMRLNDTGKRKPIGRLIGAFKTVSTKHINIMRGTPGIPVWQRNYYEHIIRNDTSLNRIRAYIVNNPIQWELDMENPNIAGSIHEMTQPEDEP